MSTDPHRAEAESRLDPDTLTNGTSGPFKYWESDHTALVHVIWNLRREGLTLADDDAEIASLIMRSRWAAAYRASGTTEEPAR